MATTHAMLLQVVIDSTNKWLDVNSVGGGDESVSITEGTYTSIIAALTALETALQGLGGDWAATTVALHHTGSTTGLVKFTGTPATGGIEWKTGAHGSDNLDTHIGTVCGFVDTSDDTGATSHTGTYQHMYGWYAPHGPAYDSQDMPDVEGPEPVRAASGLVRRITNPNDLDDRVMRWEAIYKDHWHPDDSATNEDFVTWWREAARGTSFRYYTAVETPTLAGTFAMITPVNKLSGAMTREGPGAPYFSVDMTWDKDPT